VQKRLAGNPQRITGFDLLFFLDLSARFSLRISALFLSVSRRNVDRGFTQRDDRALAGIGMGITGAESHLILHKTNKLLHLAIHVFHTLAHLQDNRDARNIYAQVPGQIQDELQPL
jgi:hypothetical protein